MISIHHVGRALISFGIILLLSGIVIYFADVLNLGKLPGDIIYKIT